MSKIRLESSLDTCFPTVLLNRKRKSKVHMHKKVLFPMTNSFKVLRWTCAPWNKINTLPEVAETILEIGSHLQDPCSVPLLLHPWGGGVGVGNTGEGHNTHYLRFSLPECRVPLEDIAKLRSDNRLWKNTLVHFLDSVNTWWKPYWTKQLQAS